MWAIALSVLFVLAIGAGFVVWLRSDTARPVDLDDVVDRFRLHADRRTVAATTMVEPGVYVYDTTGSESVDALGGSRHRYPATTTITVTGRGERCVRQRWDALHQRWGERVLCRRGAAWVLVAQTTFHSFFRQNERREFTCQATAVFVPRPDAEPGSRSSYRCNSGGSGKSGHSDEVARVRVVGRERLDVGGSDVETLHVRYDVTGGGESTGGTTIDRWFAVDVPGLLVRETNEGWTKSDTVIGTVNYDEKYEIRLRSLEPMG